VSVAKTAHLTIRGIGRMGTEQIVHGRIFQTIDAVRAFVARYNVEWLIEKNGHRSPAHIRAVWQAQLSPHSENVQRFQRLKPM
jgi:hypothetical protein